MSFSFNDLLIEETPINMTQLPKHSLEDLEDDDDDDDGEETKLPTRNKTLLVTLMKQVNLLHETNSKIFRNLHETKGKWVNQLSTMLSGRLHS